VEEDGCYRIITEPHFAPIGFHRSKIKFHLEMGFPITRRYSRNNHLIGRVTEKLPLVLKLQTFPTLAINEFNHTGFKTA